MGRRLTSWLLGAAVLAVPVAAFANFTEGFNTGLPSTPVPHGPPGATINLSSGPWFALNNSQPLGTTGVFQQGGAGAPFPAQEGAFYAAMNFNNGAGLATISTWFMTPEQTLQNGDTFSFWTRGPTGSTFPDRLQVRMSQNGASTNTGGTATSTGDFSVQLLEINPNQLQGVYPQVWTQFTATVSGLAGPTQGRLAFRYFVTGAGPSGLNSDFIGIDSAVYTQIPEPATAMLGIAGIGLLGLRRRRA
jgi:hypothetical protein